MITKAFYYEQFLFSLLNTLDKSKKSIGDAVFYFFKFKIIFGNAILFE